MRYRSLHARMQRGPELFDLEADPHETNDLAVKKKTEIVQRLSRKIDQWYPVNDRVIIGDRPSK